MTRNDPIKHFFIWPALLIVLVISIFPLVYSLTTSFMSMRLVPPTPARFVGFGNYIELLSNPRFWHVAGTTTLIAFISVGLQYVIGLSVAVALNARVPGEGLFRFVFLLPMLVAPVAVALIARQVLNPTMGPLNEFMTFLGFPNLPFLTQTSWALGSIIVVEVWQWTPFVTLVMLAGMMSLPRAPFEAAMMDGARPFQIFRDVMLPLLRPVIALVLLLRGIDAFKEFDKVFLMTGGGPGTLTELVSIYAYRVNFRNWDLGYGAAVAFMIYLVVLILCSVFYKAVYWSNSKPASAF